MRTTAKTLLRAAADCLPNNTVVYRFCRRYVNRHRSDSNGDPHSNGEYRWLREVLPSCARAFDVGANVGNWAAYALGVNPNLEIHCFEPTADTYRILERRQLAGAVTRNQTGLSSTAGQEEMHIFGDGSGMNSLHAREGVHVDIVKTEKVPVETLDGYCHDRNIESIDLLKIDVEGHELDVLKGAVKMLSEKRIHRIQFEYGGTFIDARILLKDMFALLAEHDYSLHKMYPNALHLFERYDQQVENFQYSNWVALLKECD